MSTLCEMCVYDILMLGDIFIFLYAVVGLMEVILGSNFGNRKQFKVFHLSMSGFTLILIYLDIEIVNS